MKTKKIISLKAPAKINLILQVTGRRFDGYHFINSLMQSIDLCDYLSVKKESGANGKIKIETIYSPKLKPYLTEKFLSPDDPLRNICGKTASAVLKKFGISQNINISIKKNIPIGAGLGGDSADGAAAAIAVNELFSLGLNKPELCGLIESIGADIPFNIYQGTAQVTGIGEIIEPLTITKIRNFDFILIYPGIHSSTPEVYKNLKKILTYKKNYVKLFIEYLKKGKSLELFEKIIINDLILPAYELYPSLKTISEKISRATGKKIFMSGSGSTMFLIYDNEQRETKLAHYLILKKLLRDCFVIKAAPL